MTKIKKWHVHHKARPPLLIAMAIASMIGFVSIILDKLNVYNIQPFTTDILFVILGVGLVFEGNIVKFIDAFKGKSKITDAMSSKVVTLTVGFASTLVGLLSLFQFEHDFLAAFQLLVAIIALLILILETWFQN